MSIVIFGVLFGSLWSGRSIDGNQQETEIEYRSASDSVEAAFSSMPEYIFPDSSSSLQIKSQEEIKEL